MKKVVKNIKLGILELIIAGALAFIFYTIHVKSLSGDNNIFVEVTSIVLEDGEYQLFYVGDLDYNETQSVKKVVKKSDYFQVIKFELSPDSSIHNIRIDFGNAKGNIIIKDIVIGSNSEKLIWGPEDINGKFSVSKSIEYSSIVNGELEYINNAQDPYIYTKKSIEKEIKDIIDKAKKHSKSSSIRWSLIAFFILFLCVRISGISEKCYLWILDAGKFFMLSFFLLISIPGLNMIFDILPESKNYEKRKLAVRPLFSDDNFGNYTTQFNTYFNENFGLRNLFVKLNSYYKLKIFDSSPDVDKVIVGKNDWLFLPERLDQSIQAEPLLSLYELSVIEKTLEERTELLKSKGIDYYVLICPEKSAIYPEYLPSGYRNRNINAKVDQLFCFLKKNKKLKLIDVRQVLLNKKSERVLYYTSDTHWNYYGALLAYDFMINRIREDFPEIKFSNKANIDFFESDLKDGDLSELLSVPELYVKKTLTPKIKEDTLFSSKLLKHKVNTVLIHKNNKNNNGKKIYIIHDSFALFFLGSMSSDFSELTCNWTNIYNESKMEEMKPDIVVHEFVSRFIRNVK